MKNAGENLNLQAFFQRSRDHLLRESSMKNVLYVDEAFVAGRALPPEKRSPDEAETPAPSNAPVDEQGGSVTRNFLRTLLKGGLVLAAILVLPGALIGAPLLWWLGTHRKKSPQPMWKTRS
jgi:hypothetical protein